MTHWETVLDQTYVFDELSTEQVRDLLAAIACHYKDITYYTCGVEEECEGHTHYCQRSYLAIKRTWEHDRRTLDEHSRGAELPLLTITDHSFCCVPTCWQEVAYTQVSEQLHVTLFFNQHGEDVHEIHSYCPLHLSPTSRTLMKTLEMVDLTPEEETYWTRLLLWHVRGKWYAQRVETDQDGDWESGYWDYCYGTPHLGPFKDRDAAIKAATDYKH